MAVTDFQERVYLHLLLIPRGRVTTYGTLARALNSSPRAVGGALRSNPYAPLVPCHRVIASDGYVGGFKGDWEDAPSGVNQCMKLDLLTEEGVKFDADGRLLANGKGSPKGKGKGISSDVYFDGPWNVDAVTGQLKEIRRQAK